MYLPPQKFDNRAIIVSETEMQYWRDLSVDLMSEESDDPNNSNSCHGYQNVSRNSVM